MRAETTLCIVLYAVSSGCGGATPAPVEPAEPAPAEAKPAEPKAAASPAPAEPAEPAEAKVEIPKPVFKPNMGVEDAIKAIPQGAPRMNMSDEDMQRPLMDPKQYAKCAGKNPHFSLKVAVYDGAAVGVDVQTKPKNPRLEKCVDELVRRMVWVKVASLNTVTFNL
jgi:hypothetical protein